MAGKFKVLRSHLVRSFLLVGTPQVSEWLGAPRGETEHPNSSLCFSSYKATVPLDKGPALWLDLTLFLNIPHPNTTVE